MRRVILIAGALGASLAAAPQEQRPVFRSGVELVRVDVSVREGPRIATGLAAADFEVLDNGVAQQIEDVSFGRLPIDVTVALDISQSVSGALMERLRQGVVQLMADLRKEDRLKLMLFNSRATRVVDFTGDVESVERAIRAARAGGGTALADAIGVALVSAPRSERRQLVVFFTDGADASSVTDQLTLREVAQRTDATLVVVMPDLLVPVPGTMVIVPQGDAGRLSITDTLRPAEFQALVAAGGPRRFFQLLTAETGGSLVPVTPSVNLSSVFVRILGEFRSSYVLHYRPSGIDPAGYHALTVRVKKPNMRVTARRGYFGG
jgi:VWFA-related protein